MLVGVFKAEYDDVTAIAVSVWLHIRHEYLCRLCWFTNALYMGMSV